MAILKEIPNFEEEVKRLYTNIFS